ncbi:MAG TPA: GNAT family N-acetyltransferase [Alphaproteobacteria bacterium]|nr:GNAT family N-acetyltransferase [Alphaproteobacteria bacterium]
MPKPDPNIPGLVYRHLTPADCDLLDRVDPDVFDGAIDPQQLQVFLGQSNHALIVAVHAGIVIGQIRGVVHHQPDSPPQLYLDNLGVAPDFQRQGVARRLLTMITAWAKAQGCTSAWVATETDNDVALSFYRAFGFETQTVAYCEVPLD